MMPGWPAWLKPALVGALGGPGESRALYRPYRFVKATPLNRRSFVRFLREGLGGIEAPEETVATAHDLHSLVQRFRTRLVRGTARPPHSSGNQRGDKKQHSSAKRGAGGRVVGRMGDSIAFPNCESVCAFGI